MVCMNEQAIEHAAAHGEIDPKSLLLIVVGAHLRAEVDDRPLAYRLHERVLRRQRELRDAGALDGQPLEPLVCTDLWYLNDDELLGRPVIALGDPATNAATAYLSNRLPTALVVEPAFRVLLDPEFLDVQTCLWGVNPVATASAVDAFIQRYMDEFLIQAISGSG